MAGKEGAELQYLNHYYEKEGSRLVVLYGQKNIGMSDMILDFCHDKPQAYYRARPCSEREQLYLWGCEQKEEGASLPAYPSYAELFDSMTGDGRRGEKSVVVIEEFQNIVKQSVDFVPELIRFLHNGRSESQVMVILASTSIGWVENSMVRRIGAAAYEISGFIKIKEQGFFNAARRFPEYTKEQQIEAYAVLGGFPGLWRHFEAHLTVKENICRHILQKDGFLHEEALRLVSEQLRETGVYHAILEALASGRHKLNDLHLHTGFSRAKISVYLKNLMELEIVEKVFSYDTEGRENTQKGIYRIQNRFVAFYFRYLYPHMSRLALMAEDEFCERFYETYIAPDFGSFAAPAFAQACREYMDRMNCEERLPIVYTRAGEWIGKAGSIDLVAQDEAGRTLIGLCSWEKPVMSYEDYERLLLCARQAKLSPDYIYLFSALRFDESLTREAEKNGSLRLIGLDAL
ncbi:MAG: ATP-binding protein [Lachnospiraceae bacterium]|nr:ATP-binding protein [Lachnospiraceae bacterium]